MNQRTETGQFPLGKSGNPSGRPSSENAVIRKQLAAHSDEVVQVIMSAALGGDLQACKMILDRISPPLKAQAAAISVSLPAEFRMDQVAQSFITAAAEGSLAPDVAVQMVTAVGHLARIVEVTELSDRLEVLERCVKKK